MHTKKFIEFPKLFRTMRQDIRANEEISDFLLDVKTKNLKYKDTLNDEERYKVS